MEEKTSHDIVIAEGLFVFYEDRLVELFDKKIFMSIKKETFLARKSVDLRWGKEPDWYMEHIWNSHQLYCQLFDKEKYTFPLSGENPVEITELLRYLNK